MLSLAWRVQAKILQASTSEVYGVLIVHSQTENHWAMYRISLLLRQGERCAETLVRPPARSGGEGRPTFDTDGPRMHPNDARLVSNFVAQALRPTAAGLCRTRIDGFDRNQQPSARDDRLAPMIDRERTGRPTSSSAGVIDDQSVKAAGVRRRRETQRAQAPHCGSRCGRLLIVNLLQRMFPTPRERSISWTPSASAGAVNHVFADGAYDRRKFMDVVRGVRNRDRAKDRRRSGL